MIAMSEDDELLIRLIAREVDAAVFLRERTRLHAHGAVERDRVLGARAQHLIVAVVVAIPVGLEIVHV